MEPVWISCPHCGLKIRFNLVDVLDAGDGAAGGVCQHCTTAFIADPDFLQGLGDTVVHALGEAALADCPNRKKALDLLLTLKSPAALDYYLALIDDRQAALRVRAVLGLIPFKSPAAVEGLIARIGDANPAVRLNAVLALGEYADECLLHVFRSALADTDARVRAAAVWAIGRLGVEIAERALPEFIADPSPTVKTAVLRALAGTSDPAVAEKIFPALKTVTGQARIVERLASRLSDDVRAARLLDLFSAADRAVVEKAVTLVAAQTPAKIFPGLKRALASAAADVRDAALDVLGTIGGREAFELVATCVRHPNEKTRRAAVAALGKTGAPEALKILSKTVDDPDRAVRLETLSAIAGIDDPAVFDLLAMYAHDADAAVGRRARKMLAKIDGAGHAEYALTGGGAERTVSNG